MQRYKLTIEYDGAPFCGWQTQANGQAVQDALSRAIEQFCGETPSISAAGRTDKGVHARGQVAHIDLEHVRPAFKVRDGLNFHLRPDPISVVSVEEVDDTFHARFSAIGRSYLYQLVTRRAPPVLDAAQHWWVKTELDIEAMNRAAQIFLGQHDFTTFRSVQCQSPSPIKTLDLMMVWQEQEYVYVRAEARSFLHNQVRSLVGALKVVGQGRWSEDDVVAALSACDRAACPPVAPAHGLFLMRADYPAK